MDKGLRNASEPAPGVVSVLIQTVVAIVASLAVTSMVMIATVGTDFGGLIGVGRIWMVALGISTLAPAIICPLISVPLTRAHAEVRRARDALAQAAFKDPLTGLLNRRGFEHAAAVMQASDRAAGLKVVAMCDLDHFKSVNDRFGHEFGDLTLEEVGRRIVACLQGRDALVCRRGGEEFAVLTRAADAEDARTLGETIRAACSARPIGPEGEGPRITVSLGVALAPAGARDLPGMLRRADKALYAAKAGGRDRVVMAPESPDLVLAA